MVSIAIRFLAGRYHATGWDHHVNEGLPEWPPAPFRILRALTAASYRLDPRPSQDEVIVLLNALSADPVYALPPTSQGHTRHFMPTYRTTTKVFDSFIAVGDGAGERSGEIVVSWPGVKLGPQETELLVRLLGALGYLGRAESWVECELVDDANSPANTRPLAPDESVDHETRLLACESPASYESWRRGFLAADPKTKFPPPASLWEVLHTDTGRLHAEGWSSPPGTRWVRYGFDAHPFRCSLRRAAARAGSIKPTIARYALHSSVLPRIVEALSIGERMRQALMAHSRDEAGISHRLFLGRDDTGAPLKGQRHAFFLPEDADGDGFVEHIVVWARDGFDPRSERALRSVERLWGNSGHEIWLVLANIGATSDIGTSKRSPLPGASTVIGPGTRWRSVTPFVPQRHTKLRGGRWIDSPEDQLRRSLEQLGLTPTHISPLPEARVAGSALAWHRFRRRRLTGGGSLGDGRGVGFELSFAESVSGPIAVGYGAHFGLGCFEAIE
jgi:CRISPR-associated protein Csb2